MARKNAARDALIADIKKRQRAAGQKVSRLERQGVRIKANKLDPRRNLSELSEMSTRELHRYHESLNRFTSRGHGFVAGVRGKPIPKDRFGELKRLEAQYNARAQAYEASIGNIDVPGAGRTIEARLADLKAEQFRAGGQRRTFETLNRQAKNLTGPEAVEDFIKQMKQMLSPTYLNKRMKIQRENLEQMLTTTGDQDVLKKINRLTNNQLNVLLDYTYFMNAVGGRYAFAKALNVDTPQWQAEENEDNAARVRDLIDWAGTLPRTSDQGTNREYTSTNAKFIPTQQGRWSAGNPNAGAINLPYSNTNAGPIPTQRGGKGNRKR